MQESFVNQVSRHACRYEQEDKLKWKTMYRVSLRVLPRRVAEEKLYSSLLAGYQFSFVQLDSYTVTLINHTRVQIMQRMLISKLKACTFKIHRPFYFKVFLHRVTDGKVKTLFSSNVEKLFSWLNLQLFEDWSFPFTTILQKLVTIFLHQFIEFWISDDNECNG